MTTVVLGDFNDWLWAGSVRKALSRALPGRHATPYVPLVLSGTATRSGSIAAPPMRYYSGRSDVAARAISDHLPVIAECTGSAGRFRKVLRFQLKPPPKDGVIGRQLVDG